MAAGVTLLAIAAFVVLGSVVGALALVGVVRIAGERASGKAGGGGRRKADPLGSHSEAIARSHGEAQ